jgi:hypothetical protein
MKKIILTMTLTLSAALPLASMASLTSDASDMAAIVRELPKLDQNDSLDSVKSIENRGEYHIVKFKNLNGECKQVRAWVLNGINQVGSKIFTTKHVEFENIESCK